MFDFSKSSQLVLSFFREQHPTKREKLQIAWRPTECEKSSASFGIYQIKSNISDGDNSVSLYWKVALIKSEFKILDVIVENTSYFVTKKAEFTKLLRKFKGDLSKLTEEIDKI